MSEPMDVDVLVLGTGSGGENVALGLARAGRSVVAVEDHLVGGECKYIACIPSKAMLRSAEVRALARRWVELGAGPFEPQVGPDDVAYRVAVRRREDLSQHATRRCPPRTGPSPSWSSAAVRWDARSRSSWPASGCGSPWWIRAIGSSARRNRGSPGRCRSGWPRSSTYASASLRSELNRTSGACACTCPTAPAWRPPG